MVASRNRGLVLALAGIALLLAVTLAAYQLPKPLELDAPATVFSAQRAYQILAHLLGNGAPHPLGSAENARVRDAIVARLKALGYASELQTGWVCNDIGVCGQPTNIIAQLAATAAVPQATSEAVLLAAHYDSVPAGPGASDDGTGIASLLEIARMLAAAPAQKHPVVLLFSDGEESGLLGALLFVREHPLARRVKAAVNLDNRGTSGPSLMFETGTANSWVMNLYATAVARPMTDSLYYSAYHLMPNSTDFTVFKAAGYQGFNYAYLGDVVRYHTPLDTVANASLSSIQHQGDNALASVLALANADARRVAPGESVYFDVFSRALVRWPVRWALAAALLTLGWSIFQAIVLIGQRAMLLQQVFWGAAGAIANILGASALIVGLLTLLRLTGRMPPREAEPFIAHPLPMSMAAVAAAFLAAAVIATAVARRAGFWGAHTGTVLLLAAMSVGLAAYLPGTSFALQVTMVAALLGALPAIASIAKRATASDGAAAASAIVPLLVYFAALLPLVTLLYSALGTLAWPVAAATWSMGTALLLPLLAIATRRARQGLMCVAGLVVIVGVALTASLPAYTAGSPERLNFEYWLDADTATAHWSADPDSSRLPASVARFANFEPQPRSDEGDDSMRFFAPAPLQPLAAPNLWVTAATALGGGITHLDLRVQSLRGAAQTAVVFAASARVASAVVMTQQGALRVRLRQLRSGATRLMVVGVPAAGFDIGIDVVGDSPVPAIVFDESYGLPATGRQPRRPGNATSSQAGDLTGVEHTVRFFPAAGR